MKPQIVIADNIAGFHNSNNSEKRLEEQGSYKDRSTVCIVPTRGMIHAKVVQNWMGMMTAMNQKFMRMFAIGMEVGEAYQQTVEMILAHEDLRNWKYIMTLEEDNMIPPDAVLKLYQAIDEGYDAVGALYWTKGEGGQPMCYGNPNVFPLNFIPQIPQPDTLTRCNGLGMGCTLFKMDIFKEGKIEKPFFKTLQHYQPGVGAQTYTQDLYFFEKASKAGYRFACDSRVKVGHYDVATDVVW